MFSDLRLNIYVENLECVENDFCFELGFGTKIDICK